MTVSGRMKRKHAFRDLAPYLVMCPGRVEACDFEWSINLLIDLLINTLINVCVKSRRLTFPTGTREVVPAAVHLPRCLPCPLLRHQI